MPLTGGPAFGATSKTWVCAFGLKLTPSVVQHLGENVMGYLKQSTRFWGLHVIAGPFCERVLLSVTPSQTCRRVD